MAQLLKAADGARSALVFLKLAVTPRTRTAHAHR